MGTHVNYWGLVVAGIGFFLTRFTVTLAIYEEPLNFYLAGVVPLVLGLGLAAFGVALAVADVERSLVRTTALWCVAGAGTMLVLVLLTLLGSTTGGLPDVAGMRSQTYLSNFLIGGSVGGTLTGLYASRNRRQRGELRHQANRLEVLNRLLRHEILNSVTVIRGYGSLGADANQKAADVIERRSDAIEETIEEVNYLTQSAGSTELSGGVVEVEACLEASVEAVREQYPDANVALDLESETLAVRANERLEQVFTHLLENAVAYSADKKSEDERPDSSDTAAVEVSVSATANRVSVSVSDDGPGLPESQQVLLETGDIDKFDNPDVGFGLNVVRLLVESYQGSIETEVDDSGTTITVVLPRARIDGTDADVRPVPATLTGVRPAIPNLVVTLGAAILAGVVYGLVAELLGGSIGIIGVLYGVESTVVGWLTHEFHSAVFGFVFAGLLSLAPPAYRTRLSAHVAIGLAWGLFLWFVAAGFVSAVWLRLVGIPAPLPNLSMLTLVSHVAWGVSLGALTAMGYEYGTPWLAVLGNRLRGRTERSTAR
ncbi:sensor histidine kinase [Halorussus halophilus]|uniref:sensor histidine kinase n=1 Tax=Halorussus halophilus TaxID=2650975 RepID=UPI0013011117|nr:HAMP domain-containing sensor histidine kinase [Halorussus halophilus]